MVGLPVGSLLTIDVLARVADCVTVLEFLFVTDLDVLFVVSTVPERIISCYYSVFVDC